MAEYVNFDLNCPLFEDILGEETNLFCEIDPSLFDEPFLEEIQLDNVQTEVKKDPKKESGPDPTRAKRFKTMDDADLNEMAESRYSESTKRNSKWGFSTFSEWCQEKNVSVDLKTVTPEELSEHLTRFYAEIAPKPSKLRRTDEYHKNSLKNIRSALNRYLQVDCNRKLNIVSDSTFKQANDMLNGKLKFNAKNGLSELTKHKNVIPKIHMMKINEYIMHDNPVCLRYRVWMHLGIHFVARGLEFHSQLSPQSFRFLFDETGLEYVSLVHNTQQKNHQGDLSSVDEYPDKRMYATDDALCPVKSLKQFLEHTNPLATSLFNHLEKDPVKSFYWYGIKPVGKRQFSNFMPDICKNAGLDVRYTAHCLRATAITAMTDENVPGRHIMSLSDHASESSLVPYARPSSIHKQKMSKILSNTFNESALPSGQSSSCVSKKVSSTCTSVSHTALNEQTESASETNPFLKGFLADSTCTFNNCSFHITQK